ncbi:regulatory protein RecX [Fusibacter bizertensis]|uniref:Regulatory protein RecX n=1 Tax=Fusibacter bizertensis TaxID=1488331 RepID=A0ABT6NET5_9FIRM|nr:regulatory protein RecX [Fusibacter bizertensis]MDH8678931.1 regulatory protein RecX [Fusibacter bizertensis]
MKTEFEKGMEYALYLLSLQMRTVKGLEDKLIGKAYSTETIERVLNQLKEVKYLDDVNYAYYFIRSRRLRYGDYRIKLELGRKGVSRNDIEDAYDLMDEEEERLESPEEIVSNILEKKIASTNIDWDRIKSEYKYKYKIYQKLASFLASRGFSHDVIKSVLGKRLADEFIDEE